MGGGQVLKLNLQNNLYHVTIGSKKKCNFFIVFKLIIAIFRIFFYLLQVHHNTNIVAIAKAISSF